jgi:hypothetical protein
MTESSLTALENAVLEKVLTGDHPFLTCLRAQIGALRVEARELTGVGFFTEFAHAHGIAPCGENLQFGDVEAEIPNLQHGAGFLLYVRAGLITMLEGYTYDEDWPSRIDTFSLRYSDPTRTALLRSLG